MGRTIQTARGGKRVFKTKKQLLQWMEKESEPKWSSLQDYKPQHRLWIVTKQPVGALYMVDCQKIQDHEGDDLYRVVYSVSATGEIAQQYGFVRVFTSTLIKASEVETILDENVSKRLDNWVKSAQEDVEFTTTHGFRDTKVELKPCKVKVPGWKPITKAQAQKNIRNMAVAIFGGRI